MVKKIAERPDPTIKDWCIQSRKGQFEIGLDSAEKHSGTRSVCIKSLKKGSSYGQISQAFQPDQYFRKRVRLSGWMKTSDITGCGHFWIKVDGTWGDTIRHGSFDNMDGRPVSGTTDWTKYSLVIDVPENSTEIWIGAFLDGTGTMWVDDIELETVGLDVPLTGIYTKTQGSGKIEPLNLNFEQD